MFLLGFLFVIFFWPCHVWDLSPLPRDPVCTPTLEAQCLNHWTARETPVFVVKVLKIWLFSPLKSWNKKPKYAFFFHSVLNLDLRNFVHAETVPKVLDLLGIGGFHYVDMNNWAILTPSPNTGVTYISYMEISKEGKELAVDQGCWWIEIRSLWLPFLGDWKGSDRKSILSPPKWTSNMLTWYMLIIMFSKMWKIETKYICSDKRISKQETKGEITKFWVSSSWCEKAYF